LGGAFPAERGRILDTGKTALGDCQDNFVRTEIKPGSEFKPVYPTRRWVGKSYNPPTYDEKGKVETRTERPSKNN